MTKSIFGPNLLEGLFTGAKYTTPGIWPVDGNLGGGYGQMSVILTLWFNARSFLAWMDIAQHKFFITELPTHTTIGAYLGLNFEGSVFRFFSFGDGILLRARWGLLEEKLGWITKEKIRGPG